ncbi:glycosyltransferase family 92 protein RCOM_0530710-like isoform X2 [Olea europaea var. sylvestris]|uniref:glycosyltransferase family 92 protein RCOM_0530710-like isoform X2 n=1 Tax=Olea europaea var. sylvestris TaxID=158386 RepID=UPI000C1CEE62|nr:glycosyltransferase family 92 protein RCOM_0530710-like isoform X2 [Olea europaea var. sylvestris]
MKDRKKRSGFVPWGSFFRCTLLLLFFSGFTLSTFRLFFRERFRPRLVSTWRMPPMKVIAGVSPSTPPITIQETVIFPDQALIYLKYPSSTLLFTKDDIDCIYLLPNSSEPQIKLSPVSVDGQYSDHQTVRCPRQPRDTIVSLAVKSNGNLLPGPTTLRWDSLAYEAIIDRDNTTVVFVKGLSLRSGRVSDPSKFKCLYGWDLRKPKFVLWSEVVSVAQEIVRCKTPLSILNSPQRFNTSIKVSIRVVGRQTLKSIARPKVRLPDPRPLYKKQHEMCICTMLRNQARFLPEWIVYHSRIGVQRWFLYDNNSDDDIEDVVESLVGANYNVTRHVWPWIKTQEAGFAHCALRARDSCEWVGFIDVDEFFHLPLGLSLYNVVRNQSRPVGFIDVDEFFHLPLGLSLYNVVRNQSRPSEVAELRVSCHSFGPSGLKKVPVKGVTVGYTCRLAVWERHKSIMRPEALNSSLINMVHHFHLQAGFRYANMDRNVLVINHYKYQVWEVFKEKFYRRVATYVSDWQQERNVGSKDRTPGLGTKAVEPPDWSTRFCEVEDTGLRDRVLKTFTDPKTGRLPWQHLSNEH